VTSQPGYPLIPFKLYCTIEVKNDHWSRKHQTPDGRREDVPKDLVKAGTYTFCLKEDE